MLLLECFGYSAMQDREGDDRAFEKGNWTDPVTSQLFDLFSSASFISSWWQMHPKLRALFGKLTLLILFDPLHSKGVLSEPFFSAEWSWVAAYKLCDEREEKYPWLDDIKIDNPWKNVYQCISLLIFTCVTFLSFRIRWLLTP
jgi:hypothetical protein